MIRIGVDTGGTFTDFVMLAAGLVRVHKLRSTPDDPSRAILQGIAELTQASGFRLQASAPEFSPEARSPKPEALDIVHGSTVATNALLERKGARVAFLTTEGFEDILRIGRQTRRELYNFQVEDRQPLVDTALTFGVRERIAADGQVLVRLDEADVEALAERISAADADSVALCLLHAYLNSVHERALSERLERDGLMVSASHRVLPEYREFERASTTVVNAYVTPRMTRYLDALERQLPDARLSIMQSNGGSISAAGARAAAVQTILSGPAAGVVGAQATAAAAGYARVITFDMGGTSTDVSLVDGRIGVTSESTVGDFPVRLPILDIHTVGAGGGSIAYVDSGGSLRVGPRSAGAEPGPVCYGVGTELTATDANLLLGRLDPGMFFGGRMTLDEERARTIADEFARRVNLDPVALADGIVRIANANMERAIRVVSVQRGFDPRDFALLAFGGAGGMHACDLAEALDIRTVVAPRHAGVLSALGMLLADATRDYSRSILRPVASTSVDDLQNGFAPLVERARMELAREGFGPAAIVLERSVDVRYTGQSYEITVPFTRRFRTEFDRKHEQRYGYADRRRPTEVVNLRVKAVGRTAKPPLKAARVKRFTPARPSGTRRAWFSGRPTTAGVYAWGELKPGMRGQGPAIIAGAEATVVVPPAFQFHIDGFANVIARRARK
ncbi:MAG: hydantoinase/oxoprolinase family protein [Acidobacteria bacterium]|nr:hydantoinase/oxoprolinase family protein [Acidobacteriota bacterium]